MAVSREPPSTFAPSRPALSVSPGEYTVEQMTTDTLPILLFAQARDALGTSAVAIAWSGGTVADLRSQLAATYPALVPMLGSVAIAVNQAIAAPEQPIALGDEVALLPPFGGG